MDFLNEFDEIDQSIIIAYNLLELSPNEIQQEINQLMREHNSLYSTSIGLKSELRKLTEINKKQRETLQQSAKVPFLIGKVEEIFDLPPEPQTLDRALNNKTLDETLNRALVPNKGLLISTTMRETLFSQNSGLVPIEELKPNDLIGVNKDTKVILQKLPNQYDTRVKTMEVTEKPTETYNDVGGLNKELNELTEAIVLPMTHKEKFEKLGIQSPKGVMLYGPPGTGKTLMARACAAQTNSCFLKLAGSSLVQSSLGEGAKMVRELFELAKEKAPSIIFIDEIDAVGGRRNGSEHASDRDTQRTMLELLNQLDGFEKSDNVRVIAATNRIDILDPALLRSGRFDRKIEFPLPNEEARIHILKIHSKKLKCSDKVNYEELSRSTVDFNGAQLKAVCAEAGIIAMRRNALEITHEDFQQGVAEVQSKKKKSLSYFA